VRPPSRQNIVDAKQHLVEFAPDNLTERWRSADAVLSVLRRNMWSYSTHCGQFANIFRSKPPSTELATEVQDVGINVTIAR
jgi:hypothetical protein